MTKIQRFVWGRKTPNFIGYCPYFWFTWLSLLVAPFAIILFVLALPFVGIAALIKSIPEHPTRPSHAGLLILHEDVRDMFKGSPKLYEHWLRRQDVLCPASQWILATPDWWNCVLAAHVKEQRALARQEKRDARDAQRLTKVANNLHYIVRPAAYVLGAAVVAGLGRFVFWVWPMIYWPTVGEILLVALLVILAGVAISCLIMGIETAWKSYRRRCPRCPHKVGFWRKVGRPFAVGFEFLCETVEAVYTRECPLIEWSDASAPIERMGE